ncbi:S9 family peptidase [Flavobacterium nitrogenifigens]|uniref:Dipeptidyl aminopeptidase/acylaminoacyl peptidase n=1 Tax=Flavobacterium nitrogenifigens TaxID=1617283 RepID=A0A521F9X4_9FLAO|nr:prolyl oligopeptidase family serine peptidase [Flavobacterium nitrogenifigens]KAF2337823.1 prolyl oligopeptidase family serine peptidase [Flavobacterium nitrogenifigens]SMO92421.1 Dipeptidyl aminopeptidase/acylaminoacyl peptidase [Flavobacterium nitrogenifigens]
MPIQYFRSAYIGTPFKNLPLFLVFLFVLQLETCPLWGQGLQKKELQEKDYRLWAETSLDRFSADALWASYSVRYENGTDTLFIRSTTDSTKTYRIPAAYNSHFTVNQFFYAQSGNSLHSIDLKNGEHDSIPDVLSYEYAEVCNLIILLKRDPEKQQSLLIQPPRGNTLKPIAHAAQYSLNPKKDRLLFTTSSNGRHTLSLMNLRKMAEKQITSGPDRYTDFSWSRDGRAVAFFSLSEDKKIKSLFFYRTDLKKLFEYNATSKGFPEKTAMATAPPDKILISEDLKHVFFHIRKEQADALSQSSLEPEIWNANDKLVHSYRNIAGKPAEMLKVMVWNPEQGKSEMVSTEELPSVFFNGNQKYAILSDPLQYEPQFHLDAPRDYYLLDLATMKKKKILAKASSFYEYLTASPDGRYLVYFKDGSWRTYDIEKDRHADITRSLKTAFAGKVNSLVSISAFGNPGWSSDNAELLLYDQYDIWAVKPDGSSARRLTHGREKEIVYRFGGNPSTSPLVFEYGSLKPAAYDLTKEVILNGRGADEKTGFFIWKQNKRETPITYEDAYADQLHYSPSAKKFLHCRQRFDLPPQIVLHEKNRKDRIIFQSNPQHEQYYWGKSELIHFENSKRQKLKGVLYYPAHYDPKRKYPMIVHIYEIQSRKLHQYHMPSLHNETGFNPAVFTSKGYFVFLPDILLEEENMGPSALDCTESGIKKILSMDIADPDSIALMGHSFGGYETAFIANQSQLFKTAIVSGAIADLSRFYLTINWRTGRPDIWRFHGVQWNMNGKDPFNSPEDFKRNSPISYITDLKIPLLTWSGKADTQVDWQQSVEYHLALRRLGKKNVMLLYPNERHGLADPSNQEDLTRRVLQWFDYFLKEKRDADWIRTAMD